MISRELLFMGAAAGALPTILQYVPEELSKFLNIASVSTSFGTHVWVGSIAGLTMFRTLTRRNFGKVQSKLFPKYATLNTTCSLLALATYLHLNGVDLTEAFSAISKKATGSALLVGLIANLLNDMCFMPSVTKLMYEIYAREEELGLEDVVGGSSPLKKAETATDADRKLVKRFNMYHGVSMLVSLVSVGSCGVYLYFISKGLNF